MKKTIVLAVLLVSLVLASSVWAQDVGSMTIEELRAEIVRLTALINQLTGRNNSNLCRGYTFARNLTVGAHGDDVRNLDKILIKEGISNPLDLEGQATFISDDGMFIEKTASAVVELQEKYRSEILTPNGLARGTGYVGLSTRAKLNRLSGCGVVKPTIVPINPKIDDDDDDDDDDEVEVEDDDDDDNQTETTKPVIKSISPVSGPIGTIVELRGSNLAGFEGDLDAWIKNDAGEKAFLPGIGSTPRADQTIRVKIESSLCRSNNSYSGKPCTSYLPITPGVYKIYTEPWGKKSNEMKFTVSKAGTAQPSITVLSPNGGETWFAGQEYSVEWRAVNLTTTNQTDVFKVYLVRDGGDSSLIITTPNTKISGDATVGYDWLIPTGTLEGKYKILTELVGENGRGKIKASDTSDTFFNIKSIPN